MAESKQRAPHFYETAEVEMDAALAFLERLNAERPRDERITVTALLLRALTAALVEHPSFNALWEGDVLVRSDAVNIGVAIDVPDGLLAPAVLSCEILDLPGTAERLRDLTARTKLGRLRAAEWSDATFTLSNLGRSEVVQFTAIVVPPQVAILATGRIEPRAVIRDGTVAIRRIMSATLSSDHRAVDGAAAARFLGTLKASLERPEVLAR